MEQVMAERWKPVLGWEGQYEISSLGRVRSLDRILSDGRHWKGRILKLQIGAKGYIHVTLGDHTTVRVHQMMMHAFYGKPKRKMDVCHFDGNKNHNILTNLRYGTRADNEADKVRHGRSNRKEDRLRANNSKKPT
jgi:hypothetical protein